MKKLAISLVMLGMLLAIPASAQDKEPREIERDPAGGCARPAVELGKEFGKQVGIGVGVELTVEGGKKLIEKVREAASDRAPGSGAGGGGGCGGCSGGGDRERLSPNLAFYNLPLFREPVKMPGKTGSVEVRGFK